MRHLLLAFLLVFALVVPAQARPLTLNDNLAALKQAPVLLYDLPDDLDRDRALAYIREVQGYFFPRMELVDARRTPRSGWSHKLAGGFVLYGLLATGSLTSEVLAHTYGGLQLTPGRVETPMFRGAGPELRLITVGRNPFGPGPVSVYAAERSDQLVGINEAFHGPRSFHLYTRNKTLQEGTFTDAFRPVPTDLSVAEAQADARELFLSLECLHPNLLARTSRSRYQGLQQETRAAIARAATHGRVSVRELASHLYRAAAAFEDGHTSVSWRYRPDGATDATTRYPSFRLEYRDGRWAIARAVGTPAIEGQQVVSIEGQPPEVFLAPILERCSGELMAFKAARFDGDQTFYWSLTRLLGDRRSLSLTLRAPNGRTRRVRVPTVPLEVFEELDGDRPERPQALSLSFPRKDVAYLSYPSFDYSEEQVAAVDRAFGTIVARRPRALILDLRGNGGGNSAMTDVILKHLTRKKVRQYARVDLKVSPETLERFPEWFKGATASVGAVLTSTSAPYALERVPKVFSGRLYVLTDGGTFSSAADFAAVVKGYGLGTLVGSETGGVAHSFGDVLIRYLTHSDIRYGVSCKEFHAPVPGPGDDRHGVRPDVAVTERMLAPYARRADPVLGLALELAGR